MLEITNQHFNESDLLHLLSAFETMMEKVPEGRWKEELRKTDNFWKEIWWNLPTDQEVYIFREPF